MKSIQNQYRDLKEGRMSQANFMRNLRMTMPQYVTNVTSFNDSVRILKNKGIISEIKVNEASSQVKLTKANQDKISSLTPEQKKKLGDDLTDAVADVNDKEFKTKAEYAKAMKNAKASVYKKHKITEADIYGIAGDPEKEADARAMAIKRKKQDLEDDELDDLINKYDTEKQGEEDILSQWDPLEEGIDNETAQDIAMNATSFEDAVNRLWDEGVDMDIAREIAGQYHDEELYESKKGKSLHPNQIHPQELRMGIQVEMEHTDDPKKAEKIALDHLAENPFYYTQLKLSGVDTKALPTKEKKAIAKKKDETELVDKANQMKPVKGVEKIKASANKAHKETNKGVSGVQLMSLVAKSSRGVKKMDPTGEKSKKISVKEGQYTFYGYFKNDEDDRLRAIIPDAKIEYNEEEEVYTTVYSSKYNDKTVQHAVKQVLGLGEKSKFRSNVDLGGSFDKFKSQLESLVREALSEMKK
jgi:hypothetical protein